MLLGKRPQPSLTMRRTTSMSGGMSMSMSMPHDHDDDHVLVHGHGHAIIKDPPSHHDNNNNNHEPNSHITISTTIINHQYHHTTHFLRTCALCKCRLAPGRDIYMYRGDTAFCSMECREQRMKEDCRKQKWNKMTSNKQNRRASPPAAATAAKAPTETKAAACT